MFTVSNILVKYCPGVEQSEIPVTRPLLRRVKIIHIQPKEERRQQKFVVLGITAKSRIILKSINKCPRRLPNPLPNNGPSLRQTTLYKKIILGLSNKDHLKLKHITQILRSYISK